MPRQQLVEDRRQCVDVGCRGQGFTGDLFGCHIRRCANDTFGSWPTGLGAGQRFCDTEVGDLYGARRAVEHIVGFHIPVQQPPAVSMMETRSCGQHRAYGFLGSQTLVAESLPDGPAARQLHNDHVKPVAFGEVIDGHDVWMFETGYPLCLGDETIAYRWVAAELMGDLFDGHRTCLMATGRFRSRCHPS